jgi:hypothetical protein
MLQIKLSNSKGKILKEHKIGTKNFLVLYVLVDLSVAIPSIMVNWGSTKITKIIILAI